MIFRVGRKLSPTRQERFRPDELPEGTRGFWGQRICRPGRLTTRGPCLFAEGFQHRAASFQSRGKVERRLRCALGKIFRGPLSRKHQASGWTCSCFIWRWRKRRASIARRAPDPPGRCCWRAAAEPRLLNKDQHSRPKPKKRRQERRPPSARD